MRYLQFHDSETGVQPDDGKPVASARSDGTARWLSRFKIGVLRSYPEYTPETQEGISRKPFIHNYNWA